MSKNSSDDEQCDQLRPELNALRRRYHRLLGDKNYLRVWDKIDHQLYKERASGYRVERDNIALNLKNTVCSAQIKIDLKNAKILEDLLVEKDRICQLVENQQLENEALNKEIRIFEEKVQKQRVETSRFVHNKSCMSASAKAHLKRQSVLENRLNREESKCNAILASNQKLRDVIETLVNEKHKFERKYQSLDGKCEKLKSEMANILDMSLSTYEQVADLNSRQKILQDKGENEYNQFASDQMELEIDIQHRNAWIKFMEILYNQRGEYKSLKHQREIEAKIKADEDRFEKLKTLEAAWKRILECVKIDEDAMSLMDKEFVESEYENENENDDYSLEGRSTRPGTRETVSRPATRESRVVTQNNLLKVDRQASDNTNRTSHSPRRHSSTVSFAQTNQKKPTKTRSARMANKVNMIIEKSERFEEKVFALYTENNYQHEAIEKMTEELIDIEQQILENGADSVNYKLSNTSTGTGNTIARPGTATSTNMRLDAAAQKLEIAQEEEARQKLDQEYVKSHQVLGKYSELVRNVTSMLSLNENSNEDVNDNDSDIDCKSLLGEFGKIEDKLNGLVNTYFCVNRDQPEIIASWRNFTNPERKSAVSDRSEEKESKKEANQHIFQLGRSPKHSPKNSPRGLRNKNSELNNAHGRQRHGHAIGHGHQQQVTLDKIPTQGGFSEDERRLERLRTTILEPLSTVDVRKKPVLLSNKLQNSRFAKSLAASNQEEEIPEECMDDLEKFVTDEEFLDLNQCWEVVEKHYEKRIDKISYMAKYNRRSTLRKMSIFQKHM